MTNYTTIPEHDLSGGIDARSAENRIAPTYSEDLINVELNSEGHISKRVGYQNVAGCLPIRATGVTWDNTLSTYNITYTVDTHINLSDTRSTPVVIFGRTSSSTDGDLSTSDTVNYYPDFSTDFRHELTAPSGTLVLDSDDHSLGVPELLVGLVESTDISSLDNSLYIPDSLSIDTTTYDVSIGYTVATDTPIFVYYLDCTPVIGSVYIGAPQVIPASSTTSYTITAATHSLNNYNIIPELYQDTGTSYIRHIPDSLVIATNGDVTVTLTNGSASPITVFSILRAAPSTQVEVGAIPDGSTLSITIPNPTSEFIFTGIYLEPSIGAPLQLVIPDSVVYNSTSNDITVEFTNDTGSSANFEVYYEYGQIITNRISVTSNASLSSVGSDTSVQTTIWGLCHEPEMYSVADERQGWVNHIDSYRRSGESRLVAGLGGNIYTERLYDEASTSYLMPSLYPNLRTRVLTDTVISPAFHDTGDTPGRSRGYITYTNGSSNYATVLSATYNSGTTYVDILISTPGLALYDSSDTAIAVTTGNLSTIISTTGGLEDYLTLQQMGYARLNGEFPIRSVSVTSASTITISVEISSIISADYNEVDAGGLCGIFTDIITPNTTSPFQPGDLIQSELFTESMEIEAVSTSLTTTVINGVVDTIELPAGLRLVGRRSSRVIQLRDSTSSTNTVENLVVGDTLSYTPIERLLSVRSINPDINRNVTIVGGVTDAVVTLLTGDTHYLDVGDYIQLHQAGVYTGQVVISAITGLTTFEFETTLGISTSGILLGNTVSIDEDLTWEDSIGNSYSLTVPSRWIPVEAPDDSYTGTPSVYERHFDSSTYTNQSYIRSAMVNDNLYMTNGNDEVMKFDGSSIYRAGLYRWQSGFSISTDDSTPSTAIPILEINATTTAISGNILTFSSATDIQQFSVGDRIRMGTSVETESFTITAINNNTMILSGVTTYTSPSLVSRAYLYRYYYRLNLIDSNQNIIASAVTGADDHIVEVYTDDSSITHHLIPPPILDIYDWDRIEVQIYRTIADGTAPYYLITTLPVSFNSSGDCYIDYIDVTADSDIHDLDEVNSALLGAELGTTWEQPPISKYLTSTGNSLVLGNIIDYPEINIQVHPRSNSLVQSDWISSSLSVWALRRDNGSTSTTLDVNSYMEYEFTSNTNTVTATSQTDGVSLTITKAGHGFTIGDWIYIRDSSNSPTRELPYCGWWQINSVLGNTFTILNNATDTSFVLGTSINYSYASNRKRVPIFTGQDRNWRQINGNRSSIEPYAFLAMRRLAGAINASMRAVDRSISGQSTFTPWITASAGNEFNVGQLILRQPYVSDITPELILPNYGTYCDVYAGGIRRSPSDQVSAISRRFPSRVVVSYDNYPEIFDAPFTPSATESDSAIDINASDGQEITGLIPFFGDSSFGGSQKSGIIVVFKSNSIYLIDINEKRLGNNAVQRLETNGLGCTAPYSIAATRQGIMFANESGIYRLNRDLTIQYVGRLMERNWLPRINRNLLDIMQGHNYSTGRQYKLSIPLSGDTDNSEAYVYDYTRESEGTSQIGGWTRYTNHPATGWCNLGSDAYLSSTNGHVFSIRRTGGVDDYRDDSSPIEMTVLTRATDCGDSGIRKWISHIITHFRVLTNSTGTEISSAVDMSEEFSNTTSFEITNVGATDNLSDTFDDKIKSVRTSLKKNRGIYHQIRYYNGAIDEPVEIAGFDLRVAGLNSRGTREAADTTS